MPRITRARLRPFPEPLPAAILRADDQRRDGKQEQHRTENRDGQAPGLLPRAGSMRFTPRCGKSTVGTNRRMKFDINRTPGIKNACAIWSA
ncbi:hypothetical protein [Paraburkholderia sp. SIMBA_030]|uniref:hypothetical protein n=1 Tax=Paraburkholderia sp. SIMBA_030 TaxID=3085773 RepID=UPI003977FFE2